MSKQRLDVLLVELGLSESREKARGMIMAGQVYVDNQKADKPGSAYGSDCNVEVRGERLAYVSRGGLKLEKALKLFQITPADKICMDIGASTGGFTDCMLQKGAKQVYAVDVGYGQLAWKLREDARVVNMEKTNIRSLKSGDLPSQIEFFSVDVSFISLKLVLPVAFDLSTPHVQGVCLVKPQFEAGREKVGKKGVVRDAKTHLEVLRAVLIQCGEIGFTVTDASFSPITGPNGNIEFLFCLSKEPAEGVTDEMLVQLVEEAHSALSK